VRTHLDDRGTTPVAVRVELPALVDDQLWPQLDRSRTGLTEALDRRGFDVFRADAFATEADDDTRQCVLFFELEVAQRPAVERHEGPPVHVRDHARGFYETYADSGACGPFIEGDRYLVERDREFTTAMAFLDSDAILDVAHGTDVESALAAGYELLAGDGVAALAGSFGTQLAAYFDPGP